MSGFADIFAMLMGVTALALIPALIGTGMVYAIDETLGDPWTFFLGIPLCLVWIVACVSGFLAFTESR